MVQFAGWEMPLQYSGVIEEHLAVRHRAGLFDVSHMGEILIRGGAALAAVQHITCNDASRLADGQAQYSALTTEKGAALDDILVYRLSVDEFLLCVNAANDQRDLAWVRAHVPSGVEVDHASDRYAQIALQGPEAEAVLSEVTSAPLARLPAFSFLRDRVAAHDAIIARTGYTGEDGFEIFCSPASAPGIWWTLMRTGEPRGLIPAGLGARDTLRLEACLALYGNELDDETSLLEARLGFIVKLDKGEFIGREALLRVREAGPRRKLVGFQMIERGVARHGYPVALDGEVVGQVTSGTYAPFLRKNLGLAYLPAEVASEGREFDVIIRAKPVRARVVPTPFYKRPVSRS